MDSLIRQSGIIFHLAAAVGVRLIIEKPVDTIKTNILGTENILKYANKYNVKVVIASTSEVYGKNDKVPFKEEDDSVYGPTTKSRWSYACSKAIDEFLALAYFHEKKLPVIIVRLFNTIGPRQTGQYGMVVPTFVKQALLKHDITVFGDGKQARCFANVRDVVRAITELAEKKDVEGQVYNIGSQEKITIRDLAKKVKSLCNSQSKIVSIPYDDAFEKGFEDMSQRMPDTRKLKKEIGFAPTTSLDDTIKEIIAYYKR
jgi:UDP-glucose 4-epimerase